MPWLTAKWGRGCGARQEDRSTHTTGDFKQWLAFGFSELKSGQLSSLAMPTPPQCYMLEARWKTPTSMRRQMQSKQHFSQQSCESSELAHLMLSGSLHLHEPRTWNSDFVTVKNNHQDQKEVLILWEEPKIFPLLLTFRAETSNHNIACWEACSQQRVLEIRALLPLLCWGSMWSPVSLTTFNRYLVRE